MRDMVMPGKGNEMVGVSDNANDAPVVSGYERDKETLEPLDKRVRRDFQHEVTVRQEGP